jgi:hypothetical protein
MYVCMYKCMNVLCKFTCMHVCMYTKYVCMVCYGPGEHPADLEDILGEEEEKIGREDGDGHLDLLVHFLQRTVRATEPPHNS